MKLLSASASPYVAKVAIAAKLAGIEIEMISVDSTNGDPQLDAANPLSKIPCLVLDDGTGIYDSRSITRYLDRKSGGRLFPSGDPELLIVERMEALCDGLNDVTVGYMYELRFHPEEKVHQPWLDRLWGKAENALTAAATMLPPLGDNANIGTCALAASLGYLDLRFAGKWENANPALVEWSNAFDKAHPELAALKPSA